MPATIDILRNAVLQGNGIDTARACARALLTLTELGITDESELLTNSFLASDHEHVIHAAWIGRIASVNAAAAERLVKAATDGQRNALLALAQTDPGLDLASGEALGKQYDEATQPYTSVITQEVVEEDGHLRRTHRMGINLAAAGLLARGASSETRDRLVSRMTEILTDPEDSEATRASAADAIFNLVPLLAPGDLKLVGDAAEPLAYGDYERLAVDRDERDPLSRIKISRNAQDRLRAASLSLLARIAEVTGETGNLEAVVDSALRADADLVVAEGLRAWHRCPALIVEHDVEVYLASESADVRRGAIAVLGELDPDRLENFAPVLASDHDVGVRSVVLHFYGERGVADAIEGFARSDPDAGVRRMAANMASEP
jgi:hypothetical protein